jgi:hypothetical protein
VLAALVTEKECRKLQGKLPASHLAQTDDGKFLQRAKSDVDFTGGGRLPETESRLKQDCFSICFDAKDCRGGRFPLGSVADHQVRKLKDRARCGWVSGLLIRFADKGRAFFLSADLLETRFDRMLAQSTGKRAKPGTASISFTDIEQLCSEIFRHPDNGLWDWLPVVQIFL